VLSFVLRFPIEGTWSELANYHAVDRSVKYSGPGARRHSWDRYQLVFSMLTLHALRSYSGKTGGSWFLTKYCCICGELRELPQRILPQSVYADRRTPGANRTQSKDLEINLVLMSLVPPPVEPPVNMAHGAISHNALSFLLYLYHLSARLSRLIICPSIISSSLTDHAAQCWVQRRSIQAKFKTTTKTSQVRTTVSKV
jgi:hypothetical protein